MIGTLDSSVLENFEFKYILLKRKTKFMTDDKNDLKKRDEKEIGDWCEPKVLPQLKAILVSKAIVAGLLSPAALNITINIIIPNPEDHHQ